MMRSAFARLRGDQGGAAIIEMAFVAPIFAALLIGMTDLARAYSMKLQLEQSAQRAIEQVEAQKTTGTDYSSAGTEAQNAAIAAGYSDASGNADFWLECNGTRVTSANGGFTGSCTTGQTTARYVDVTVSAAFTPMFGVTYFATHNSNGTVTLTGHAGLRIQ